MKKYAIELKNVSKIYSLKSKVKGYSIDKRFYALKDISVKISKGEVCGILGTNGSGKSTLSLILAGISEVDEGQMTVNGEQLLIGIRVGLNNQLTGIENIELKGALMGLSRKKIREIKDEVIEFADIGDFIYQPVKKYSSGMKSRLGFAINVCLIPEILIVDEALSVGDKAFAEKCLHRMKMLKESGKTIIFISHSLQQVREFCDTALWIEGGMLQEYGEVNTVCNHYAKYVEYLNSLDEESINKVRKEKFERRIIPPVERKWKMMLQKLKR